MSWSRSPAVAGLVPEASLLVSSSARLAPTEGDGFFCQSSLLLVPGRPRRSSVALRLSASISMDQKRKESLLVAVFLTLERGRSSKRRDG